MFLVLKTKISFNEPRGPIKFDGTSTSKLDLNQKLRLYWAQKYGVLTDTIYSCLYKVRILDVVHYFIGGFLRGNSEKWVFWGPKCSLETCSCPHTQKHLPAQRVIRHCMFSFQWASPAHSHVQKIAGVSRFKLTRIASLNKTLQFSRHLWELEKRQ